MYISPNSHANIYTEFCELVKNIVLSYSNLKILIVGDFNLASSLWFKDEPIFNTIKEIIINSFLNLLDLNPHNNIVNFRQKTIYMIFSNSRVNSLRKGISFTPHFGVYHPSLEFLFKPDFQVNSVKIQTPTIYNFNKCNFDENNDFLSHLDILSNLRNLSVVDAVKKFYEVMFHTFDDFVPKTKINLDFKHNATWSNSILRNLINLKKTIAKKI